MELDQKSKEGLKTQRLNQYKQKIFILQMDVVALEAVGDAQGLEAAKKSLENVQKAYAAVEAI